MQSNTFSSELRNFVENNALLEWVMIHLSDSMIIAGVKTDHRCTYNRSDAIRQLVFFKLFGVSSINELFGKSLSQLIPQSKDVFYRTATKININWRRLLLRSAQAFVCVDDYDPKTAEMLDTPCFIIDDTDIPKRGKCMEIIGRVYSHVSHSFAIGYKSLNLAMWTSRGLFHIDFSYHIEMGKDGRQGLS